VRIISRCRSASLFGLTWFWLTLPTIARDSDNLRFSSIEQLRTKTDARERDVQFELSRGNETYKDRLDYQLRETPRGSIESTVKAIDFRREVELSQAELYALFDRLIAAGIYQLPKSAEHRGNDSLWGLWGFLKGHKFELSYRQPPASGVRKKVDDTVTAIIREFGLNKIGGPSNAAIVRKNGVARLQSPEIGTGRNRPAVTETEGDLIPARPMTLRSLITHAAAFDGRRVSVVGFYHDEFEGSEIRSSERSDYSGNLWCSDMSAFAAPGTSFCQDCWVRMDGVFLKGPGGHFGLWPGELARVTRVEIQERPRVAAGP
jgi:hypothetical protein